MKVLLCDDIEGRGRDAVNGVRQTWGSQSAHTIVEFDGLFAEELQRELTSLFDRARLILDDGSTSDHSNVAELEDTRLGSGEYDIVILDNNLKALDFNGMRFTADAIAGYVRAFTEIPYVISLNKKPEIDFDLSFLVGDRETPADVAVNQDHIENRALWSGRPNDSDDGFCPWYWPALYKVSNMRRQQIAFVEKRIDVSVLDSLCFPDDCLQYLSRRAIARLCPHVSPNDNDLDTISGVTFGDFFVDSCSSLPVREERLKLNRDRTDSTEMSRVVSRVAAAEIDKWIQEHVLGPQDVLVDIPHLLMRMPFLIGNGAADIDRWNDALYQEKRPYGLNEDLFDLHLVNAVFRGDMWLRSPSLWWPLIKSCEALNEVFYVNSDVEWEDAVFCEDVSTFKRASDNVDHDPEEFATELEGSWARRYVARVPAKNYVPGSRFAT